MHPPPPSSIHSHPASSTSTQLISYSTQLISASTQLSATPSTLLEPKYCTKLGNFLKFRPKNSKLSVFIENWHTSYLGGADSEFGLRFLKFRLQNPFLDKFGPKNSKLFVLPQNCFFCLKFLFGQIWTKTVKIACFLKKFEYMVLEDADSYSNICFFNFELKFHFWPSLSQKSQICPFCLKIGTLCILRMQILIPRLVFWILKPKSI